MQTIPRSLQAILAAVLFLTGPAAPAQTVPWHYTATFPTLTPDGGGPGSIGQTPVPGSGGAHEITGPADITVGLMAFTRAPLAAPDRYTDRAYRVTFTFQADTMMPSGQFPVGELTFTGLLDGTLSYGGATLHNRFTGPRTQTLTLGPDQFTVTIGPFAPLRLLYVADPPDWGLWYGGRLDAHVAVHPAADPPAAPEPSTLLLASLGLGSLGLGAWRRRRRGRGTAGSAA